MDDSAQQQDQQVAPIATTDDINDNHYPPPPQPDQQHYNPIYPSSSQQLSLEDQQDQLDFAAQLSQHAANSFAKLEHEGLDPATTSQIERRIEQLQQQSLEEDAYPSTEHLVQQHAIPDAPPNDASQAKTNTRLRKACDQCALRKVKCDENGPPCKACAALDIPCTFERPTRRRGPPNKHAEAIKRRRLEEATEDGQPASPTHAAEALATLTVPLPTSTSHSSAEKILPEDIIAALLNDYFTLIHPLYPFPHEPSFREAWRRREDRSNRPFLGLLSAMIAALVAAYPTRPRLYIKTKRREKLFVGHIELINTCFQVCASVRGPAYLESDGLTVHDAATSFLLGIAATTISRFRVAKLYLGECYTIIRSLGLHEARGTTYQSLGTLPSLYGSTGPDHEGSREELLDNLTLQVSHRLFWSYFAVASTWELLGASHDELVMPSLSPAGALLPPPLPLEVEDAYIFPGYVEPQPLGPLPSVAAFNASLRVHLATRNLALAEASWSQVSTPPWRLRREAYRTALQDVKGAAASLPAELRLVSDTFTEISNGNVDGSEAPAEDSLPVFSIKNSLRQLGILTSSHAALADDQQRRAASREIQKAEIHSSALAARAQIIERYWSARESSAEEADELAKEEASNEGLDASIEMFMEREDLVQRVVVALSGLERTNIEAAGDTYARRIRIIATRLINAPAERKGPFAQQADEHVGAVLYVLSQLQVATLPDQQQNELLWVDARGLQDKLAELGAAQLFPAY